MPPTRRPGRDALLLGLCLALPTMGGGLAAAEEGPIEGSAAPAQKGSPGDSATGTGRVEAARATDGSASAGPSGSTRAPAGPTSGAALAVTSADGQPPSALPPVPTGSAADKEKWLAARIDEILGRPALVGVRMGLAVAEVDTGRSLYARNEKVLQNPASNAKLFTTAAALALLGPEYKWKTGLYAQSLRGGDVVGDLYFRGTGDPALVNEDLWRLVADLAALGVKAVKGGIVVDDSYFDDARVAPAFEQKTEDFAFRAPSGALSLNYNACAIHVAPGPHDGAPPRVVVEPKSAYFTVVVTAKTVSKGKAELAINTREIDGHTEVTVAGTIKKGGAEIVEHRRVAHPDLYAAYSLKELLQKRGIKVATDAIKHDVVPAGARLLASHSSPPLGVVVRDVNKTSNNFMAEQVLKTLGAEAVGKPGTWPKGVQAVGRFLDGLGVPGSAYKMTNGSGLYDADRFTAQQVVDVLRAAYRDFRWAADFVGSLALSGADGTIGHRMEGSPAQRYVRAKTGTLSGVSCLSGYAGAPGKLPLVFSILMNAVPETATGDARKAQDAIAEALVVFLQAR